jgi:hypothetical protein
VGAPPLSLPMPLIEIISRVALVPLYSMNTTLHLPFGMELSHNNSIYIVLFQNFHCFFVHASLSMIFVHASLSLDLLGVNTRPDLLWITALFTVPFSFALPCYLIHIGNWVECNLDWNQTRDYKICNHKFDFSPNLHDTKFNFHFIIFTLKS